MKYQSKQTAIEAARAAGSSAQTFKGAAKFLVKVARNTTPLEKRGMPALPWRCGHAEALDARYLHRAERIASALHLWARCDAIDLAESLNSSICEVAISALNSAWPYKRSESRWAGGDHHVAVTIGGSPSAAGWSTREWSSNGKWQGTDSHASLTITPTTISLFPTLMTPDGLALIDAEKIAPREYRIIWLEQGRGFDLKRVPGWLVRGVHVQAPTIEQARKKAFSARKKATAAHLAARMEKRDLKLVWVGLDDSFAAGNCKASTMAFYESLKSRYGAEVGGLRADELLRIRDDIYTRRAVAAATRRLVG